MMTPDPAELERQHLADLLEAMMRCAFFSDRLSSGIPWPLTGNLLESRRNDFELFDKLAAFNERFSKLQDSAAATMRHATLLSGEKTTTFLEVLVFFEKVGVVTAQGVLDRGRAHYVGPCAHAVERAAKDRGVERSGLHQRKERDPYCAALYEAREELRRAGILGTRVFRGYGGSGYRNDQAVYCRSRKRGPKARPTGDALD